MKKLPENDPKIPNLYRNENGDLKFTGKPGSLLHSDDMLDGRTEVHLFATLPESQSFSAGIEHTSEICQNDINIQSPEKTPEGLYGIILEYSNLENKGRDPSFYDHTT